MIDCHVHTALSHHGIGTVIEGIEQAIDEGIEVIGFTEHSPLPFDHEHRLTESETAAYLRDLERLQAKYANRITILKGLEADYYRPNQQYVCEALCRLTYDFALGSVHFIELDGERLNLWDFEAFRDKRVISAYFEALSSAIQSGMFEAIAHPDIILRAGVEKDLVRKRITDLIPSMSRKNVGYEVNCSGITKNRYDPFKKMKVAGPSFPDLELAAGAYHYGIPLTIGSDAHETDRIGSNVAVTLKNLSQLGVGEVTYFRERSARSFPFKASDWIEES